MSVLWGSVSCTLSSFVAVPNSGLFELSHLLFTFRILYTVPLGHRSGWSIRLGVVTTLHNFTDENTIYLSCLQGS